MKKLILAFIVTINILSCNNPKKNENNVVEEENTEQNSDKNADGSFKYICAKNIFSDFIVMNSSLENNSKPHIVKYAFKGIVKNNTLDIYKSVALRCELIFVLENGNELNCNDFNYSKDLLGSGIFSTTRRNWKSNENWEIEEVLSCPFSTEYFDYPVKEVYTQFFIEVENQVNKTNEEILISQRDVTDLWKIAKKKHQNNSPDCKDTKVSEFLKDKYPF